MTIIFVISNMANSFSETPYNSCTMTNLVYGICTASAFYVFPRAQPEGIHIMHEWYKSIHRS